MTFILFLLVISVLVLVHEFGHLIVAKATGMKVHEFGLGFPPRALTLGTWGGTRYTINWIPFGGYVKIAGEDPGAEDDTPVEQRMGSKSRFKQFLVLVAGVVMNVIFAWVLFVIIFLSGVRATPDAVKHPERIRDVHTVVTDVVAESPAALAGIPIAAEVRALVTPDETFIDPTPELLIQEIRAFPVGTSFSISYTGDEKEEAVTVVSAPSSDGIYPMLGIALDRGGIYRAPLGEALVSATKNIGNITLAIGTGLGDLFGKLFTGQSVGDSVTGPVGIAQYARTASTFGFSSLLVFIAFLSLNLAVLNLLPLPALDGGRIVIVAFEGIIRRPLPQRALAIVHTVTFFLLIGIMVIVTIKDVIKLF